MKDFLGNELNPGDWVAASGRGNNKAEYGMILFKVVEADLKLRLSRLIILRFKTPIIQAETHTFQRSNKYVKVFPSPQIINLFEGAVSNTLSDAEKELVRLWIHGNQQVF